MSKKLALTKNRYQTWLWTYLHRREKMRQKYPPIVYAYMAQKINKQIKICRNAIIRYEKRESILHGCKKAVIEFFYVDVTKMHKYGKDEKAVFARNCFYKFCIEHKIQASVVAQYLSMHKETPIRGRKNLTRSFSDSIGNRELYHKFLKIAEGAISTGNTTHGIPDA